MMGVKLSFFLALMVLLPHFHCLNWQGTGVLSYEMQNTIWNYINTNFDPKLPNSVVMSTDKTMINFSKGLSTQLNDRFDRAWNVVVTYIMEKNNYDSVFYGYGFREHWFWYNGYKMNDGYYVSFIVWKDYNCQTYLTFNYMAATTTTSFNANDVSILGFGVAALGPNWRYDDPWRAAYSFVNYLQTSLFKSKNGAFSIIVTQTQQSIPFAYVCALNYEYRKNLANNGLTTGASSNNQYWGNYMLFQMR